MPTLVYKLSPYSVICFVCHSWQERHAGGVGGGHEKSIGVFHEKEASYRQHPEQITNFCAD